MEKNSKHKSTSALIVLQHYAGLEIVCQSAVLLIAKMPLRVGRRLAQLQQRKAAPIEPASLRLI